MLSYKKWIELRESTFNLGVSQPQSVLMGKFQYLDEKKFEKEDIEKEIEDDDDGEEEDGVIKKKKVSSCDNSEDQEGDESDNIEDKTSNPMFCKKGMKKKSKVKNECDCEDMKKKKPLESDQEDNEDEDDMDDNGMNSDDGENEGDDNDMKLKGKEGKEMKKPLGFMKSGKKSEGKKKVKKESTDDFLNSFTSYTCPEKDKETNEKDFWKSIAGHLDTDPNKKNFDGFSLYEDYLISPEQAQGNNNQSIAEPGDVGFAPQQRLGWLGNAVQSDTNEDENFWGQPIS